MSARIDRLAVVVPLVLLTAGLLGVSLLVRDARAQVLSEQAESTGVITDPTTVLAPVTMTKELKANGGVISSFIRSGDVRADTGTFGSVDAGTLNVTGPASFGTRPTGVVLSGSLVKAAATGVAVGCSVFGTTTVAGALVGDACVPSAIPTSALTLGITYDCYVTAPATVTLRSCGLVSLVNAPAGTYQVRVIGP